MVQAISLGRWFGVALLGPAMALTGCGGGDGPDYSTAHPRIYLERNRDRLAATLAARTPAAVRLLEVADAWAGGTDVSDFIPWHGALLGQLTGDEKYCKKAVEKVDAYVKAEVALIDGGEAPQVARDSYLEVGDYVGGAMLVYDWCYASTSSSQRESWLDYAEAAVWNVWHPDEAEWGGKTMKWTGWSIDNPSNNYYYSFLRATMLLGLAAHGESGGKVDWRAFFRDEKVLGQLVPTFESDLQGGGSREGTGYGVAMHRLWELYDFWQGSTGEDLASRSGHAKASMLTFMHQVVPTLDRMAPTGDHSRDSTASLFDYHRNYLNELAYLFREDAVAKHAVWLADNSSVPKMETRAMVVYDVLYDSPLTPAPLEPLGTAHFAPGIGQLYARSDWSKTATWVNLVGGPYTESHAHQDQGSLLFYKGEWLAYDPNIASKSGIEQDVDLHNLVRFVKNGANGDSIGQQNGTSKVLAVHRGEGWVHAAVDLKPVYKDASIQKVERELVFLEPDTAIVFDRFTTATTTTPVWQLSSPFNPTTTPTGPLTTFVGAKHTLKVERVLPSAITNNVVSWRNAEFSGGYRFEQIGVGGPGQFLNVLYTGDAVTSVAPSNAGNRLGVTVQLEGGRTATVRFGTDGVDGTIEITGGAAPVNATLGNGIDALPAFR
jgi:hypothetical protein